MLDKYEIYRRLYPYKPWMRVNWDAILLESNYSDIHWEMNAARRREKKYKYFLHFMEDISIVHNAMFLTNHKLYKKFFEPYKVKTLRSVRLNINYSKIKLSLQRSLFNVDGLECEMYVAEHHAFRKNIFLSSGSIKWKCCYNIIEVFKK